MSSFLPMTIASVLFFFATASAQTPSPATTNEGQVRQTIASFWKALGDFDGPAFKAQSRSDVCHVYVLDVAKARKAAANFNETGDAEADKKALSVGQTLFPEFHTVVGEEELTTKTYRFPGTNLVITASVYYTDESMASTEGSDSMLVSIVVSPKPLRDALSAENNAVSELTNNDKLDTVRAKKYLRVNNRLYMLGIECRCNERIKTR